MQGDPRSWGMVSVPGWGPRLGMRGPLETPEARPVLPVVKSGDCGHESDLYPAPTWFPGFLSPRSCGPFFTSGITVSPPPLSFRTVWKAFLKSNILSPTPTLPRNGNTSPNFQILPQILNAVYRSCSHSLTFQKIVNTNQKVEFFNSLSLLWIFYTRGKRQ